ncbi:VanZ family protein [Bacillus sp. SORGH_AS 510]|uniref:VanZ family protein n=1 Tax=Bacillus sp. SORGH_AS_0510 TaxID=3041771 RepID=UPI00277E45C8|nr:VanZ family protein [Bacillus sp. SORGH_AS_0510]MDQ1144181.1 VanZ family protein [Bacillus sp. SORGH_AS_0510]
MGRRKWWIIAAIIWMTGIFCATQLPYFTGENTSQTIEKVVNTEHKTIDTPSADHGVVKVLNFLIRKATHLTVFGILAFLLFKSVETSNFSYLLAWILTALYAMSDEYHQSFMPGRTATYKDVLIDSFGALVVLSVVYLFGKKKKSAY